jgi:hypothetical protein
MEFVLENIDTNNYRGDILFYWLERNITFNYTIDKIKQEGDKGILRLENKLQGTYRLGHNLQNKKTNEYDDLEINIYSRGILELEGGKKKRLDWIYFNIFYVKKDDIIIENYNKDRFREQESDVKRRTEKMNLEYWNNYWKCLHLLSVLYPLDPDMTKKMSIKRLLKKIEENGLKCNNCKIHFRRYLSDKNREKIVSCKEKLIKFFVGLHNNVNKRNKKREWSREEVKDFYKETEIINSEILLKYNIDIKRLLENNEIDKLPYLYNSKGRERMKRRWGLFILEK